MWDVQPPRRVSNTGKGGDNFPTSRHLPLPTSTKHLSPTPFQSKPASCPLPDRHPAAPSAPTRAGRRSKAPGAGGLQSLWPPEGRRQPPWATGQSLLPGLAGSRANRASAPRSPRPPPPPRRRAPSSPSLRDNLALTPGLGRGAFFKPGRQKGVGARRRSGFPRPEEPPTRRAPLPGPATELPGAGQKDALEEASVWGDPGCTPQFPFPIPAPPRAPSPRRAPRRPGPTQRDPREEESTVQRPGRGPEEPARVAEEVRGALAQAAGHPDVVEAQEAAAGEGQAPAALGVVHSGDGPGVRGPRAPRLRPAPTLALRRPGCTHPRHSRRDVTRPAPPPSDHARETVGRPMRGQHAGGGGLGGPGPGQSRGEDPCPREGGERFPTLQ